MILSLELKKWRYIDMEQKSKYKEALEKAKKYSYKGLKLEDTGIYDTLEEAVKYAKRYQDVNKCRYKTQERINRV